MVTSDLVIKPDPSDKTAYNKWYYEQNKPFPIRFGEFKMPMLQYANDMGHSLHHLAVKAFEEYCLNHGLAFVARNKKIIAIPPKKSRIMRYVRVSNKMQMAMFI